MRSLLILVAPALVVAAATLWGDRIGAFHSLQTYLNDFRASLVSHEASGDYAFVAIDSESLTTVGTWPWPRSIHAALLNRLTEAGARDVLFDIDFSFAADDAGDQAFETALAEAGNAFLAVFSQSPTLGAPDLVDNLPLPRFAQQSWLASVNVFADRDGIIRHYPYATEVAGAFVPSAAALLSGVLPEGDGDFPINYAIRPDGVPTLSASDVLRGDNIDRIVQGRSIIIGASAIELGDLYSTAVHGVLPGPMIHLLAAETLAQDSVPANLRSEIVTLALFLVLLALQSRGMRNPVICIGSVCLLMTATEAAALAAFSNAAIIVPTAQAYPAIIFYVIWRMTRRISINAWVIRLQANEVKTSTDLLQTVFEDSTDAIIVLDENGAILKHSRSAEVLFGENAKGALRLPGDLRAEALAEFDDTAPQNSEAREGVFVCGEEVRSLAFTVTVSQVFELEKGREIGRKIATLSIRDITLLQEQERMISYLSNHDELTGALRRHSFLTFLDLRLEDPSDMAVFVLSLSNFATVSALLGRDVGDQLLVRVVERIEAAGLGLSAVARLGGATFAVYSEGVVDHAEAEALAIRLKQLISEPFATHDSGATVTARIGYSCFDAKTKASAIDVLTQAEEALQAAEMGQATQPKLYDPALALQQMRARQIEREMSRALEREEFSLVYQPQHRVSDGKLIGSEALARWHNETLGPVYPDEFIGIAESSGFILDLGRWVLSQALQDAKSMPGELTVAVNVSGIQMQQSDILGDVQKALAEVDIPPERLCLELTETVLLGSTDRLVELMSDIHFCGVSWALDDFGTGYSSMAYLSRMPLDKIKLDKSFISGLGYDLASLPILKAVRDLCHNLGTTLLCEGVETPDHLNILRALKCDEAQGYHFGRPMTLERLLTYANQAETSDGTPLG